MTGARLFCKRPSRFSADDTPQTLQLRVIQEATVILPKAIALFAAGRIQIEDRKVIILGGTEND